MFKVYLVRFAMVVTWLLIIFCLLYAPNFLQLTSEDEKTINVFMWAGLYDLHYISKFEKKTGIKVRFSYYESNEELLVKFSATDGKGYDLIVPGDYMVDILRKKNLLKKLDKTKMPFFKNLNPILLGHYYDPNNDYSIPAEWSVFGIGIDKDFFKDKELKHSWEIVFDSQFIPSKIVMSNDHLIAIPLVALYLFGSPNNLTVQNLEKVKEVLIKQRPFVEAYVDFRPDYYLATKNCPLAVSASAFLWRSMYNYEHVDFIVPKEGSIVTIENFAIPKASNKEDLVYEFLKFILTPESVKYHFESENSLFPVTTDVFDKLDMKESVKKILLMTEEDFKKFAFFRFDKLAEPVNEQYLQDLFISVRV